MGTEERDFGERWKRCTIDRKGCSCWKNTACTNVREGQDVSKGCLKKEAEDKAVREVLKAERWEQQRQMCFELAGPEECSLWGGQTWRPSALQPDPPWLRHQSWLWSLSLCHPAQWSLGFSSVLSSCWSCETPPSFMVKLIDSRVHLGLIFLPLSWVDGFLSLHTSVELSDHHIQTAAHMHHLPPSHPSLIELQSSTFSPAWTDGKYFLRPLSNLFFFP